MTTSPVSDKSIKVFEEGEREKPGWADSDSASPFGDKVCKLVSDMDALSNVARNSVSRAESVNVDVRKVCDGTGGAVVLDRFFDRRDVEVDAWFRDGVTDFDEDMGVDVPCGWGDFWSVVNFDIFDVGKVSVCSSSKSKHFFKFARVPKCLVDGVGEIVPDSLRLVVRFGGIIGVECDKKVGY
jgi:hypothetical protein